jgi:phosphatidylserine decarboxylase
MSTAPKTRTEVRYRDRRSGEIRVEQIPAEAALRWFYEKPVGRLCCRLFFGNRHLSRLYGRWQDRPSSRTAILPFVERFQIDLNEVEHPPDQYPTFNAFFTRRLKPGTRPFDSDPTALCSPADGKALVFPEFTPAVEFPVKGASVTPASLLASADAAQTYDNGSALIVRLAPPDYHRFHFPEAGQAGPTRLISGQFHSVNPIALNQTPNLFSLNQRAVAEIDTETFGRVAIVEVGAFAVASIVQTYAPGPVQRGQEKGYFQFGGSTLVLLFEPHRVTFDPDLARDSADGLEVQIRTGEVLGSATR